jgi:hypothetical protein
MYLRLEPTFSSAGVRGIIIDERNRRLNVFLGKPSLIWTYPNRRTGSVGCYAEAPFA